jgi:hypothetical protein
VQPIGASFLPRLHVFPRLTSSRRLFQPIRRRAYDRGLAPMIACAPLTLSERVFV